MTVPPPEGQYPPPYYAGPPPTGSYIPPMQYPPGWGPQHYPYAPAPYPFYPPYPYLAVQDRRPGQVTAGAVLGYVVAGFLFTGAMFLFFGASFLTDWDDVSGQTHSSYVVQFVICGLVNLVAGGLLIAGGLSVSGRSVTGRTGYTIAALIVVVEAIYWMIAWGSRSGGSAFVYAVLFAAPVVVGVWLIWCPHAVRWLDGAQPTRSGSSIR